MTTERKMQCHEEETTVSQNAGEGERVCKTERAGGKGFGVLIYE